MENVTQQNNDQHDNGKWKTNQEEITLSIQAFFTKIFV